MNQGDEKKPFQNKEPDGVIRTPGNPRQEVIRMKPPETIDGAWSDARSRARTEPIPLIFNEEPSGVDVAQRAVELESSERVLGEYFFRRHLRDALERLFVHSIGPRWYTLFVYAGLALLIVPVAVMVASMRVDLGFAWVSILVSGLVSWYPVGREIYRHKKRTVKLIRFERGMLIVYGQPTSLFWGFTGDGDGDESFLEGSTEIRKRIGLLNRFPFFGCGDITIYGKVEGGRIDFRNVPRVKRLQRFLSTQG